MTRRVTAWLLFAALGAFILLTLELAYETSLYLQARGFLWPTVVLLSVLVFAVTLYLTAISGWVKRPLAYARAVIPLLLLITAMMTLRASPSERFHFLEYGLLYVLALRAVLLDIPGPLAYAVALFPSGLMGWLDEWVQSFSAVRYFDPRDIWTNALAAALAGLLALSLLGRRPGMSDKRRDSRGNRSRMAQSEF
ncbi:MAG: VanZ family protein [Planctomycetota bacterium]